MNNQIIEEENKSLAFTINQNDFADMILNFLGKREELLFEDNQKFEITSNDLAQFNYLLEEKIEKESRSTINHFSVVIFYNNNMKKTINGIRA